MQMFIKSVKVITLRIFALLGKVFALTDTFWEENAFIGQFASLIL